MRCVSYPFRLKWMTVPPQNTFHLQNIRQTVSAADEHPDTWFIGKAHAAFVEQVEAVLTAKNSRVFIVWRDQEDALVSDFHFAQRRAGHVYAEFDEYFCAAAERSCFATAFRKPFGETSKTIA